MIHTIRSDSKGVILLMELVENGSPIDLTGKTLTATFQRPNESTFTVNATIDGDPTDGVAKYVGEDGQFDAVGAWRWQVKAVDASEEYWSDPDDFVVLPNLVPAV
jgi:hypothetical protein